MHSFLVDPSSPDQLHSKFSQAANGAAQSIKQFTQLVEDASTKEVMDKAKESRMKDGEGITGWKVTEHEDWLNPKQEDDSNKSDGDEIDEEGIVETGDGPNAEDMSSLLEKFRSAHAGVEASLDEDSRTVTVGHLHGCLYFELKRARSIYLYRRNSNLRFSAIPPQKAMTTIALTAKINQNSTERSWRQSEHGLDQKICIIFSYV